MTASEMSNIQDSRILAFHGYENSFIAAVGQVSVLMSCVKGVTTTESISEPDLIDIELMDNSNSHVYAQPVATTHEDEHMWVFILLGVVLGVTLMGSLALTLMCFIRKICCFKQRKESMTMPMRGSFKQKKDIEFAGQTADQKRRSLKAMSKIVEVDESAADMESGKRGKKNMDILNHDSNNIQSIQSLAVVTDTEAEK